MSIARISNKWLVICAQDKIFILEKFINFAQICRVIDISTFFIEKKTKEIEQTEEIAENDSPEIDESKVFFV